MALAEERKVLKAAVAKVDAKDLLGWGRAFQRAFQRAMPVERRIAEERRKRG